MLCACVGPKLYVGTKCFVSYSFDSIKDAHESKKGHCRHRNLYHLRLRPPFFNDARILKPKVGLRPDQMKINLRKVFMENITNFWKRKVMKNLGHAYA